MFNVFSRARTRDQSIRQALAHAGLPPRQIAQELSWSGNQVNIRVVAWTSSTCSTLHTRTCSLPQVTSSRMAPW